MLLVECVWNFTKLLKMIKTMKKILLKIQCFAILLCMITLIAFTGFIIGVGAAYNYPNKVFKIFIANPDSIIKVQKFNE